MHIRLEKRISKHAGSGKCQCVPQNEPGLFPVAAGLGDVFTDHLPDGQHPQLAEHAAVCTGDVHRPSACLPAAGQPARVKVQNKTMTRKSFQIFLCFSFNGILMLRPRSREEDGTIIACQRPTKGQNHDVA